MPLRKFMLITCDPSRAKSLASVLAGADADLTCVDSAEKALAEISRRAYAAIFLDADSAQAPAISLCRRLRAILPPTSCALILFGDKDQAPQKIQALDAGADDYWPHPFNENVCRAYLRAILRRVSQFGQSSGVLTADGLVMDPLQRQVSIGGRNITLRSKEFDLLYLLVQQRGKALSREFLMETAWGREYFGTTKTIDFHIGQLRRKLGRLGKRIEAIIGLGYRFSDR